MSVRVVTVCLFFGCTAPAAAPTPQASAPTPTPAVAPAPALAALPGQIVYLAEAETGPAEIVAMTPEGTDRQVLLRGPQSPAVVNDPHHPTIVNHPNIVHYPSALAPNGSALAIITAQDENEVHSEHIEVRLWTATGLGEPVWHSPSATQVRNPSFAPDASFLVFEAALDSFCDIYRVDLPAGTMRRLTTNEEGNFEPAVAPNGQSIAFVSSRDGNAEVYRMHADGSEQTRLTAFHLDDWGPVWAPDSQTIAFYSNREQVDRIFLMRPDGSDQRRLTDDPPPPADTPLGNEPHETDLAWAPDGTEIAYCVRTGSQGAALRVITNQPAAKARSLTNGRFSARSPVWAPDASALVFVADIDNEDLELYRIARSGGPMTRLTTRPGPDWLPRWRPAPASGNLAR